MSSENPLPSVQTKATPGPAPGGLGRGLFASTTVQTGEDVLHITSPFVAVLDTQRLGDTCAGCLGKRQLETGSSLKGCTGCQVVKYCDKTCQAKDWKSAHSLECPIFQNLKPRILPNNARAVLRMVLRCGRRKYTNQELDLFSQLRTHIKEIRDQSPAQWERISLSSKAVKAYSGTDMKEETISAFSAKLDLNSFNLTNALYDRIGLYLHPYAALINHSCNYNSVVGFDGDELIIKAVRPIQKGEQIFISYIDTTNPVKLRRTELHDRYFFTCHCANCEKELSAPDAHAQIHADAPALQAAEQNAYDLLTECASPSDLEPEDTVQRLESTIQSLHQTYSWPVTRQPLVSLRDELIASLLSAGKFNSAFVHAAARYLRVDPVVYESESHPIRHLHAWTLARLAIHLSGGMDVCDDRAALEKSELNFSLVIWAVLGRLVEKEGDSCTVPGFKRMVREAFGEVHREFVSGGLDPRSMEGDIRREWERLGRIVDTVLEKGC